MYSLAWIKYFIPFISLNPVSFFSCVAAASSSTSSLPPVDAKDSATRKRHDSSEESQQQGSFLTEVPAKKFDQFLTEARKNSIGGNRKYSTEKRKDSVRRASDIGDKAIRILNPRIAQREKEAFDEKYNAKNFRKNSIKMEEEMAKWRAEQIEQVKRHQIREGYDLSIRKKSGGANRLMEGYVEGDIRRLIGRGLPAGERILWFFV